MSLSSTAWETEETGKIRKRPSSSDLRPSAQTYATAANTAIGVPICSVAYCHRCSLLLFLTFYICLSKQPDKCLFVSWMWSLLFSLQLVLCIARTSCKALVNYKQRYPKPDHSCSHWNWTWNLSFETQTRLERVRFLLSARRKGNIQPDILLLLS